MGSVISRDGTTIAFQKSGNGPALVLVHGTTADHTRWAPVLPALESKFAVYALDRRGRGGSGDTEPYNIEREFEDIAVVVDSIGAPVHLLGHSYGALCSLEAALLTSNIQRLILYEPPISIGGASFYSPKVVSDMQALLAKGDRDGVVTVFMREVPKVSEHDLDLLRSSPAWGGRVAAAHTSLREMDWSNRLYAWKPVRFSHLTTPTLLLLGGDSPIMFKTAIDQLHQTLANSQITVMPGQQHVAINSAPDLFLRSVLDFLTAGGKSQDWGAEQKFISVTSSQPKPEQLRQVDAFLKTFLPRMKAFPGVIAIYHYVRPYKGDDFTIMIWESEDALKAYR